ncbi:MAG: SUMF1/EgtB/PvdO family nonheme iron enzyme, partial [Planctomycetaceae bacterium]|nr:SUMF1/EgtB/PvdO family nonheme iron enzyme [Planctomycetaceae bacterium]
FDMHGNAREWCQDWFGSFGNEATVTDPLGPSRGISRVLRGGSFNYLARDVGSVGRDKIGPASREAAGGFRPARTYR